MKLEREKQRCPICGERVFTGVVWMEHFHSHEWTRRRRDRREQARQKVCPVCNRHFHAKRRDGEYCSGACRQKAYRIRVTVVGGAIMVPPVSVTQP